MNNENKNRAPQPTKQNAKGKSGEQNRPVQIKRTNNVIYESQNLDYRFNKELYYRAIFKSEDGQRIENYSRLEQRDKDGETLKKKFDHAYDDMVELSKKGKEMNLDLLWLNQLNEEEKLGFQCFKLKTGYPGLAIGLGNPHGTAFKGDIQLGMSFDYVTGIPFISGSSLKGAIRSVIEKLLSQDEMEKTSQDKDIQQITFEDYFRLEDDLSSEDKKEILDVLFEGKQIEKDAQGIKRVQDGEVVKVEIPMGKRDVFYGAMVVPQNQKPFLKQDFLAPHPSKIQSPNVLKFLAIAPETEIEFFFSLKDSILSSGKKIAAESKKVAYKKILEDFGVGAKTNVGYGIME